MNFDSTYRQIRLAPSYRGLVDCKVHCMNWLFAGTSGYNPTSLIRIPILRRSRNSGFADNQQGSPLRLDIS